MALMGSGWRMWSTKSGLGAAILCLVPLLVSEARSAELCDGRVCPPGFECTTTVSSCEPGDTGCEPFEETWCKSPDCAAGAACPEGMRCLVAESLCRPNYELPCTTNEQCGPGFICEPAETCDCAADAGRAAPACSCELSELRYCAFEVTPCSPETERSDCAQGFRCADNSEGLCANPGDPHTGCNPGEPPFACMPPYLGNTTTAGLAGGEAPAEADEPRAGDSGCAIGGSGGGAASSAWLLSLAFAACLRRLRVGLRSRPWPSGATPFRSNS
jgi:hypothetical protein